MFQIADSSGAGALWRTDGTPTGTASTGALVVGSPWGTAGQNFFFVGDDGTTGAELWALTNDPPAVPGVDFGSVTAGQSISMNVLSGASDSDGPINTQS